MKNADLNIALIQADLIWENAGKNIEHFDLLLDSLHTSPQLIVLPEMFTTGFTMNVKSCAEKMDGIGMRWMAKKAAHLQCVMAGSILIEDEGNYYNRLIWMKPDGDFEYYDKHHLFSMAGEHRVMTAGQEQKIVDLKGWKINLQICYDLRFPAWNKNKFNAGTYAYDVLLMVANWPELRKHAYESLLMARAIENISYVVWVNRVGTDGKKNYYSGDSKTIDPFGKIVKQADPGKNEILEVQLSAKDLKDFRNKFQVGNDWDRLTVD